MFVHLLESTLLYAIFFSTKSILHKAQVSSELLAKDAQTELDLNAQRHPDFSSALKPASGSAVCYK